MFLQVSVCPHREGGVHSIIRGHAWFYSGVCAWFYLGGMRGFIRGHAWFYLGGCGFIWGACMVLFGGHAWFYLGGHVWFFQFFRIQWDTVNERAVRILLECILVNFHLMRVCLLWCFLTLFPYFLAVATQKYLHNLDTEMALVSLIFMGRA